MTENAMTRAMAACVEANVPVLLWGLPGQGKTARITALGAAWGRHVEVIAASVREPMDLLGLPVEREGQVRYSPLSWAVALNEAKRGLLFIDELTTARPSVQSGLLRLVQERVVGEYPLAETVSVIAAANPPEVAVDGTDLSAPTANRFIHLDWVPDYESWFEHRATGFADVPVEPLSSYLVEPTPEHRARVAAQINGFLKSRPDLIDKMPDAVENQGDPWPSMRSWTNVESALVRLPLDDDEARMLVVKGGVGEGAATEFFAWLATADLPDPAEVMRDPAKVGWASMRPDQVFAVLNAVSTLVRADGSKGAWEQGIAVATTAANAGRPDAAVTLARTLADSPFVRDGLPADFRESFTDLFSRIGLLAAA